ncbi:MAG TPA: DapH/DapD/GlmU-related protein [Longimicrobiales bacterium]|nr:DapH/DapD/GlmU-related protein [Longimicrobiales bacterium]
MLILELFWWVGYAWFAAWLALPLLVVPVVGPVAGVVVWALLAPWSALLGMALVHRLLPRSEPGRFRLPGDGGSTRWALAAWAPSLYLTVFQPVLFNSRSFQRIVLLAFGARLGRDAWLTSRTIVREPHHVRVGARTLVGEYAHLVCSYQPRPGLLIVACIAIGDDALVGAYSHVAPGAVIGARCILEHGTVIGAGTRIGADTRIGAGTTIYNGARIGSDVTIGKNCLIPTRAVIAAGTRIPDGTIITAARTPELQRVP